MGDQDAVADESVEIGQDRADGGGAGEHVVGDAVEADRRFWNREAGVDQRLEGGIAPQRATAYADSGDGDDLIALGRPQTGGLGVEHGEGERLERAAGKLFHVTGKFGRAVIVKFGPGGDIPVMIGAGGKRPVKDDADHGQQDGEGQAAGGKMPGEAHCRFPRWGLVERAPTDRR